MLKLLDDILARGEIALSELVQTHAQEGVSLEFKIKENFNYGSYDNNDKRNLGKVISALSNSQGGLLIWGIKAVKNNEGVDSAQELVPIHNISKFLTQTNSLFGQIIAPANERIEAYIVKASRDDTGYLLVYVERSERRPHRSEAKGDKSYYKRIGDSSYPMEHYDIEDAFRRQTTPELNLDWEIRQRGGGSSGGLKYKNIQIVLRLKNLSNISALFPFLEISNVIGATVDKYGIDGNGSIGLPKRPSIEGHLFGGGADSVIHPGQSLDIMALRLIMVEDGSLQNTTSRSGIISEAMEDRNVKIEFDYRFGCKDAGMTSASAVIDRAQLVGFKN